MKDHILEELSIPVGHFAQGADIPEILRQMYKDGWRVLPGSKMSPGKFSFSSEFWVIEPDGKQHLVLGTFAVVKYLQKQMTSVSKEKHGQLPAMQ